MKFTFKSTFCRIILGSCVVHYMRSEPKKGKKQSLSCSERACLFWVGHLPFHDSCSTYLTFVQGHPGCLGFCFSVGTNKLRLTWSQAVTSVTSVKALTWRQEELCLLPPTTLWAGTVWRGGPRSHFSTGWMTEWSGVTLHNELSEGREGSLSLAREPMCVHLEVVEKHPRQYNNHPTTSYLS